MRALQSSRRPTAIFPLSTRCSRATGSSMSIRFGCGKTITRLSSIFAPNLGHVRSGDLDAEYLNIFETRTRTPYFQDAYVNGVRVQLIIGPTGTGKSVHANQMLSLEQKYDVCTLYFHTGK